MKKIFKLFIAAAFVCSSLTISAAKKGFAIVIDPISYKEAKAEVEAYAQSIEKQGLKTYIVEDVWYNPDSIRSCIKALATQKEALKHFVKILNYIVIFNFLYSFLIL